MTTSLSAAVIERKHKDARWLAGGFYVVTSLIVVDLLSRSVLPWKHKYQYLWDFFVTWELASILFTIVVTFVYWNKYISRGERTAYADLLPGNHMRVGVFVLVIVSALSLIIAGLTALCIALNKQSVGFPLNGLLLLESLCLTVGVLLLVWAELIVVKAAPDAKKRLDTEIAKWNLILTELPSDATSRNEAQESLEQAQNKRADYEEITDDIAKVLAFSDAPIGAAFFVIFLLVLAHAAGLTAAGGHLLPPFIAGAVALQLLYSNFVFYIEANGAFPTLATRFLPSLNTLGPMIRGRRST